MITPVEVFLGLLAAVLVLVFTTVAFVLITQYGKPNKKQHINPPLPEAQMPVWHSGDHFVDRIHHKPISADMDNKGMTSTGDEQLDDLSQHASSSFKGYDPLEKTDHSLHGMISHEDVDNHDKSIIDEDDRLRH
jgi:hypothetical protein